MSRRAGLLGTSAAAVMTLAAPTALAQQSQDQLAQADAGLEIEEIVVTGSRISRSSLTAPTPLTVVDSQDIDLGAEVNIGEFLSQLPSVGVSTFSRTNSNFDINNSGVQTVNLRNLGSSRTLVLVNGRRFVSGVPGSAAVDLNSIPTAMIERVDVITGGAAAVYGSDAVAGVVNFVTKDDFEGMEVTGRYETTDEGDGEEKQVDVLVGGNFANGRGNATAYFGYTNQGAVFSRDRERTEVDSLSSVFFGGPVFGLSKPQLSSFPPQGRFDVFGTGGVGDDFTYLPDGTLVNNFSTNGDGDLDLSDANGFNRSAYRTIAVPTERFLSSFNLNFQAHERVNFFLESTYARTETQSRLEPLPLDGRDIFQDTGGLPAQYLNSAGDMISNPFVPQPILDALGTDGASDRIGFVRRLAEFGPRGSSNERQTFRVVAGLEGSIPGLEWDWDVSYNYGQTTQAQISQGQIDRQSFRNALFAEADPDNPGSFRCVDADARAEGCVPINIFGFDSISADALNYVSANQTRQARIEQNVVQANLTGGLVDIPTGGTLSFAAGVEYREEESRAVNDSLTRRGLNSSNRSPNVAGSFDVVEGYLELDAPILVDTFVDYFGISGAVRISDYSTVGGTETYEIRTELAPVNWVRLRGSYSRAVRAPNIDELFDPGTQTFSQVADPCDGIDASSTGTIAENCRANAGIADRIAQDGAFNLTQAERQGTMGFIGGNPDLQEETADTFTGGIVIAPEWFADFGIRTSLTADYFNIEVDDAIFAISQNNVLLECYSDPNFPNNPLCDNITRFGAGEPNQGALDQVDSGAANVGSLETSGLDFGFDMDMDLEQMGLPVPGVFSMGAVYTHLINYDVINLPGSEPDSEEGEIGSPKNAFNVNFRYLFDNWTFQWQMRYLGRSRIEDTDLTDADCLDLNCYTGAEVINDIQLRYQLPDFTDVASIEIYAGAENLFDNKPPLIGGGLTDNVTGTATAAGVYDAIGRSVYFGLRTRF
ncbi:TonB-dependent receptor [Rhodothalassium salexigens DSM 2132]|nr:TonB-dependent receptor [Rhodothalassium salexigens DSM 2132]